MLESTYQTLLKASEGAGMRVFKQSTRVIGIEKGDKTFFLYDYFWPLNTGSSDLLARDKAETHIRLTEKGIPSIPQINITNLDPIPIDTAKWFFDDCNTGVVLKPNFGTQGKYITFCNNWEEFQKVFPWYLVRVENVNCSKKVEIINEYRCIVLDSHIEFIYRKHRPHVLGDGKSPLISLLAASQFKLLKLKKELHDSLYNIPVKGEVTVLSDLHNLSNGASPEVISEKEDLFAQLKTMSLAAGKALNLNFCSVDIVLLKEGQLMVMEVNSGIMFDSFILFSDKNRQMAINTFRRALSLLPL